VAAAQHLDGHVAPGRAARRPLAGVVDHGHPAVPELAQQLVALGQRGEGERRGPWGAGRAAGTTDRPCPVQGIRRAGPRGVENPLPRPPCARPRPRRPPRPPAAGRARRRGRGAGAGPVTRSTWRAAAGSPVLSAATTPPSCSMAVSTHWSPRA
jgi:hypothetical protein